jgi:hypothetical protein
VVSRARTRRGLALAACAVAALVVVAGTAAADPTDGALSVLAALVLAPVATLAAAGVARRAAGGWFPVAAAAVYVLAPLLATRFVLPSYRPTFDDRALPAAVGLQATGTFALGVLLAVAAVFVPRLAGAAAGVVLAVVALALWGGSLGDLRPALHETVWSVTLAEWLVVAGVVGILLRAPAIGAMVGGGLVAAIAWGAHRGYDGAGFWRSLAVAAPAVAVTLSSLGLLVPRLRPDRSRPARAPSGS